MGLEECLCTVDMCEIYAGCRKCESAIAMSHLIRLGGDVWGTDYRRDVPFAGMLGMWLSEGPHNSLKRDEDDDDGLSSATRCGRSCSFSSYPRMYIKRRSFRLLLAL